MGPQLVRCGMWRALTELESVKSSFNGAATCSLRNEGLRPIDTERAQSFNGAATCSLRNALDLADIKNVDMSFNGAATCSLRNARPTYALAIILNPSMGPQLVRCGMDFRLESLHGPCLPSMGPQLVRCGMHAGIRDGSHAKVPSMGPQLVRCGMQSRILQGIPGADLLQWGRNLFVAECHALSFRLMGRTFLQWGRNLFVAECGPAFEMVQWLRHSFNGAATCSLRNEVNSTSASSSPRTFNGAATCSLRNVEQNS